MRPCFQANLIISEDRASLDATMDCKKILEELNLYIDGDLDRDLCERLEAHLKDCERCQIVLDTTKKTIQFYRDQAPLELPADVSERLHSVLRARWKRQ